MPISRLGWKRVMPCHHKHSFQVRASNKGGLTLEAALIMPLMLLVVWVMISSLQAWQTGLLMRYAADQVVAEVQLVIPLAEGIAEQVDSETLDHLTGSILRAEANELQQELTDLASSWVFNQFLNRRLDYYLDLASQKNRLKLGPSDRRIKLAWRESGHGLDLIVDYTVTTVWSHAWQQVRCLIPVWSNFDPGELRGQAGDDQSDNAIWSADNFSRGRYFREQMGANLPFNFPVIAAFQDGKAVAIRSMDLTAPLYQQSDQFNRQMHYELERLEKFEGASLGSVTVEGIKQKKLLLVIPENSPSSFSAPLLQEWQARARMQGINLEFVKKFTSTRYGLRED